MSYLLQDTGECRQIPARKSDSENQILKSLVITLVARDDIRNKQIKTPFNMKRCHAQYVVHGVSVSQGCCLFGLGRVERFEHRTLLVPHRNARDIFPLIYVLRLLRGPRLATHAVKSFHARFVHIP